MNLERGTGFEPATTCLEGRSSTRLSYPRSRSILAQRPVLSPVPHADPARLRSRRVGGRLLADEVHEVAECEVNVI